MTLSSLSVLLSVVRSMQLNRVNTSLSFLEKLDMLTLNDSEGTLQFNGRNNMTGGFGFALLRPGKT